MWVESQAIVGHYLMPQGNQFSSVPTGMEDEPTLDVLVFRYA
jgi:hypothetical protein